MSGSSQPLLLQVAFGLLCYIRRKMTREFDNFSRYLSVFRFEAKLSCCYLVTSQFWPLEDIFLFFLQFLLHVEVKNRSILLRLHFGHYKAVFFIFFCKTYLVLIKSVQNSYFGYVFTIILYFLQEMYEMYIKHSMNPFYSIDSPIESTNFNEKAVFYGKKYLCSW